MEKPEIWNAWPAMQDEEVRAALDQAVAILRTNLPIFTDAFPACVSEGNVYPPTGNENWTTGFYTGEYWLAYEYTGDAAFCRAAARQVDSFLWRIEQRKEVDHHDMGFLYTPSCVAAYQLTGNETAHRAALMAADNLITRFQEKGGFIQAWGVMNARDNYRLIIDCLMNLPLLYWASEQTGDPVYRDRALRHTHTSLAHLVRPDFSTYHTFYFDPNTGAPTRGVTAQGYRDNSAWARGQAWGIYGLALSYRYTRDPAAMELFRRVTDFFLNHLPDDLVPYWDLDFAEADHEPRDSSAAAIAVCGMLEMSAHLPEEEATKYRRYARQLAKALWETCALRGGPVAGNGLLAHGVYAKGSPYNTVSDHGVDECNTWGDYFWMEALTRLHGQWAPYW